MKILRLEENCSSNVLGYIQFNSDVDLKKVKEEIDELSNEEYEEKGSYYLNFYEFIYEKLNEKYDIEIPSIKCDAVYVW